MSRRENSLVYKQMTYDIYVGNVPKNLTENELKTLFVKYGEVKQVLCRWKEDCAGIGYAIVKFVYKGDAERLLREVEEVSWNGHPLPIKAARRSDQSQHNVNPFLENKVNFLPDFHAKPLHMNGPDFHAKPLHMNGPLMKGDFGYMGSMDNWKLMNYPEEQNVHSVPLMLEVLCTNVEDAITFYGCPVHRFDELSNVIHALSCINLVQNRVDKKLIPKKVYAALFSEDRAWYRCTVIRTSIPNKPGMCTVRFIDYGNQEDTAYKNVSELPESLQKVPPFASKFVFSNLTCESKANKQTYLHQLTNKRMSLCAVLSPVGSEYQVLKCSCNGKDVISETVKKGFASVKKVQKIPPPKPLAANKSYKPSNENSENRKNKNAVCNGTNGHGNELVENGLSESVSIKKSRKSVMKNKEGSPRHEDNNCNETTDNSMFQPKIIIKRGSDINEIVNSRDSTEIKKELNRQSSSITIDAVISNLKLINNIRALVSQSTDDSIIQCAVNILQNENNATEMHENLLSTVNDAFENYINSMNEIKKCDDRTLLPNLKSVRDIKKKVLCDHLQEFLGKFDISVFDRKKKILETITDLASNSNDWMNVELKSVPSTLEELISEYTKVKEERWNLVLKARENTNEKHKNFMEVFTALGQEFHLNTLEEEGTKNDFLLSLGGESKRTSYAVKFEEVLKELGTAVDEEIHTLTLTKGTNAVSIIQCLLAELDNQKEKVESLCELYENKMKLYNDLSSEVDCEAILKYLGTVQEEICSSLVRLTHCRDSQEKTMKTNHIPNVCELLSLDDVYIPEKNGESSSELTSIIRDLHTALLKEDEIMERLAKTSQKFLPELCIEHSELKLNEYFQSKFLLKYNWKPEYFLNLENLSKTKSVYKSKLLDDPVIIKEYTHETKDDMTKFLQIAFIWNDCRCEFLLKIKALFFKNENTICVISPFTPYSLLESEPISVPLDGEKACCLLRQVLFCLKELHSHKIVYNAVHPSTVLIENGKVLLDFCFNPKVLDGNTILKGINFQPPEKENSEKNGDMYGFGCLVLWLLFPNLSFTATDEGIPDVAAFRSIIEEALTSKDYTLLCNLVNSKPKSRPSASHLLSKNFLSNYESYCRARNKAMNGS